MRKDKVKELSKFLRIQKNIIYYDDYQQIYKYTTFLR